MAMTRLQKGWCWSEHTNSIYSCMLLIGSRVFKDEGVCSFREDVRLSECRNFLLLSWGNKWRGNKRCLKSQEFGPGPVERAGSRKI